MMADAMMADASESGVTRRGAIKAAGGGLAALALGAVVRPQRAGADTGDHLILGAINSAQHGTSLLAADAVGLAVIATGAGNTALYSKGGFGGADGLIANSATGFALKTEGKVTFDTAGILKIPAGRQRKMADPGVPVDKDTKVLATLLDAAGSGVSIDHVRRIKNQDRIQVVLTGPPAVDVSVAWFVIS